MTKLVHEQKADWLKDGIWIPQVKETYSRGFYINQLYSLTIKPWEIASHTILAQTNPAFEQELYNSKMGLPHAVKGAQVSDSEIDACKSNFRLTDNHDTGMMTTLGIDVGNWLHCVVAQWEIQKLGSNLNTHSIPATLHYQVAKL